MVHKDWIAYLTTTILIYLTNFVDHTISAVSHNPLKLMGSLGGDTGLSGSGSSGLKDPCGYIELTPQTWADLGIDDYLAHYPNGDKLKLQEFAAELNVPNFYCGIGMQCQAGQLCSPAAGINWIILYAVQEWNNYMNSLYQAVEVATNMMQVADVVCGVLGSISAIIVPIFVPADAVMAAMADMAEVAGGVTLAATAEMAIGRTKDTPPPGQQAYDAARAAIEQRNLPAFDKLQTEKDQADIHNFFTSDQKGPTSPGHQIVFPGSSSQASTLSSHNTAPGHYSGQAQQGSDYHVELPPSPRGPDSNQAGTPTHQIQRRSIIKHKDGHSSSAAYTRYAYLEARLNSIRNRIQSYIAVSVKMATMTPILSEGGLAEMLKGGIYLNPNPELIELQENGKALAQITVLAHLFQSLNFFVTIGSDDCDSKGRNGAWNKKDELSYCTPEGRMMNIIQAQQSKSINKIQNAHLLQEKYGYSTEFLARSAWECQKKYGVYTNSTAPPPMNLRSDCLFPIAVCDCTLDEVAKLRKKKKTTVEACRIGANLPI